VKKFEAYTKEEEALKERKVNFAKRHVHYLYKDLTSKAQKVKLS